MNRLFNLYRAYVEKNRRGPADEAALKDFANKLPAEERAARLIGDDIDSLFVSPRDNKKFNVKYNLTLDMSGAKAVAWEAEGVGGKRLVALTRGNVEEYGDPMFQEVTK